jgi:RND family efflux transporter MFP subunit
MTGHPRHGPPAPVTMLSLIQISARRGMRRYRLTCRVVQGPPPCGLGADLEQDMTTPKPPQGHGPLPPGDSVSQSGDQGHLPALRPPPADPAAGPARSGLRIWAWVLGLVAVVAAGLLAYLQPWTPAVIPVAVEQVEPAPVTRVLAVNGRIAARHSVDVRALVGGALTDLRVAEGDSVQIRAELARIDSAAPRAALRQAIAGMDAALVAQDQARDTLARSEQLGANVARTTLEAAARAVQAAEQDVARAMALVDQAQAQLDAYTIRAPMTGSILALNVEPGQSIDPSTVLMTVADLEQLIVETDVDEAYAVQIRTGQPAALQLTGEGALREGAVARVSQRVDPATGGLAVQIAFDVPVSAPIGLTVTANIIVEARDAALTAPRTAIRADEDAQVVFVVVDGTARRRAVTVIDWPAARLIVTDGLAPGDLLILDATGLIDGQPVRLGQP